MTTINANIFQSGTTTPLTGYLQVVSSTSFPVSNSFYVSSTVNYPLIAGAVSFDLVPTDINKIAYTFNIYQTGVGIPETKVYTIDAIVPYSATPLNFSSLVPLSGIRYDLRDSSLLTLARYLIAADPFVAFFGSKLWANKGTYQNAAVYKQGDVVLRYGSSYQYISATPNAGLAPESNGSVWALLVSKGDTGATGNPGATGDNAVGAMVLFPTSVAPPFYKKCDNSAVSRSIYNKLFLVLGTVYGVGDGTTTFNLPDSAITGDSTFFIYTGV